VTLPGEDSDTVTLADKNISMGAFTVSFDIWGSPYTDAAETTAQVGGQDPHRVFGKRYRHRNHHSKHWPYLMRRTRSTQSNAHGFTLLEVVVSIMVAAILGTLMYQYSRTTLSSTVTPVTQLSNIQGLNDVMEKVTNDYFAELTANAATPAEETGWIGPFGNNHGDKLQLRGGQYDVRIRLFYRLRLDHNMPFRHKHHTDQHD